MSKLPETVAEMRSVSGVNDAILQGLLLSLEQHGCSPSDIRRLYQEAQSPNRPLLDACSRIIMGKSLWERAETDVEIPWFDEHMELAGALQWMKRECIVPKIGLTTPMKGTITPPRGACRYRLLHLKRDTSPAQILEMDLGTLFPGRRTEHATYLELVAYILGMKPEDLGSYTLSALGFGLAQPGLRSVGEVITFPAVYGMGDAIRFSWKASYEEGTYFPSNSLAINRKHGADHFYLVRVYR